jgi:hypothetical protein
MMTLGYGTANLLQDPIITVSVYDDYSSVLLDDNGGI